MTPGRFLETRNIAWKRLDQLITEANKKGLHSFSPEKMHELTRLYPAVAVDVARARMFDIDPATQKRINTLAIAAHGLLYRPRRRSRTLPAIWQFLSKGYPRLFRSLWPYVTLAIVLFTIGTMGAYIGARLKPSNAYLFVPGDLDFADGKAGVSAADISERFRKMDRPPMAAGITTNNISVALNAFALGITAGIGTCYLMLYNSMMLGGFAAHFANHGFAYEFWSFIAPHGCLEIFAIIVAAAAGLRLGLSLAIPGDLKRSASLRTGASQAVMLVLGTIPMFIVAGLVEGFITPSYIPGAIKIILGVTLLLATLAYLMLAGQTKLAKQKP